MKYFSDGPHVILENMPDFSLEHTFSCGQCFRWERQEDGSYLGAAYGKGLRIAQQGNRFVFYHTSLQDFETVWMPYFDLNRDYGKLKRSIARDQVMERAITYGWGIRILAQDPFETLISFILSSSNNIVRIQKIIRLLCRNFGHTIWYEGAALHSFPSPKDLRGKTVQDLEVIRAGYRAKYVVDAVDKVCGKMDLQLLSTLSAEEARAYLMQINGVGPKVADCVLLFGARHLEVFPVDVWVRRTMTALYPSQCTALAVTAAGRKLFGPVCGLAQQYLFYYAREHKLFTRDGKETSV